MATPAFPAQGSSDWYAWAQAVHDAATQVRDGRLTDVSLKAVIDAEGVAKGWGSGGSAATPTQLAADIGYDVFIIAGQSNASGTNTDLDTTRLDVVNPRVYAYSYFFPYNGTEPRVAVEPLQAGISPGSHFARWMTQILPTNRRVLLVPVGAGGTSLGGTDVPRWDAALTGSLFDQMVTTTQTALSVAGPNARLGGVIWAQGENDASQSRTQAQYTADLLNFIDFLRTQLSAPTLPFCIISMVPEVIAGAGNYVNIDAAQQAIPSLRRYTSYTAGVTGYGNGLHYTAAGQRINGRRLISGWTAALANTSAPAGAYPLVLTRSSGTSTLTNSAVPTITGTATQGQTLTASNGTWSATPDSYAYQWNRAGSAISGATSATYLLAVADVATTITVTVTAIKAGYTNGVATSAATATVAASGSSTLTNSTAPAITGTATTGSVLTVSNGTWSAPPDSYTYQWKRAGAAISGATAGTYTLVQADETQAITCTVTAVKAGYTSGTATSNTVTPTAAGGGSTTTETWAGTDGAAWPAAWSTAGGTATIQGNKGRLGTNGSYGAACRTGMTGTTGDFDMTVTWAMSGLPATGNTTVGIGVGAAAPTGMNPVNGYLLKSIVVNSNGAVGGLALERYNAGVTTALTNNYPTVTPGVGGFKARIQRTGSTVQAKVWAADAAEPGTWSTTTTDAAPLTSVALKAWLGQGGTTGVLADFDDLTANWV